MIVKILNAGKLKYALKYIRAILELEINDSTYNIIYPILFIIHLSVEINEVDRNNLLECAFYYFYEPFQLLKILEYVANTPLSPHQMKTFI